MFPFTERTSTLRKGDIDNFTKPTRLNPMEKQKTQTHSKPQNRPTIAPNLTRSISRSCHRHPKKDNQKQEKFLGAHLSADDKPAIPGVVVLRDLLQREDLLLLCVRHRDPKRNPKTKILADSCSGASWVANELVIEAACAQQAVGWSRRGKHATCASSPAQGFCATNWTPPLHLGPHLPPT